MAPPTLIIHGHDRGERLRLVESKLVAGSSWMPQRFESIGLLAIDVLLDGARIGAGQVLLLVVGLRNQVGAQVHAFRGTASKV